MKRTELTINRIIVRNADPSLSAADLRAYVQEAVARELVAGVLPTGRTARATASIEAPALNSMNARGVADVVARGVASTVRPKGVHG